MRRFACSSLVPRVAFAVLIALMAAACGPSGESGQRDAEQETSRALPPPTPAEIVVRYRAEESGSTREIAVGTRFAVELVGVPTAGYLWQPSALPEALKLIETLGGPTSKDQLEPGYAGGNHWEVFIFEAAEAGEADLVLEQRRPWESDEPAVETFRLRLIVR